MKAVPYFPLYAANIIASRPYRLMSLGERGLWISIYMECWVNGGVPEDFGEMGKMLGATETEVKNFFSKYLTAFFEKVSGQFISRELEEYRAGYENTRKLKSEGGKKGVKNKLQKQSADGLPQGQPIALPQGIPKRSLDSINSAQVISNQLINKEVNDQPIDDWVIEYDNAPEVSAVDYLNASRGG